MLQKFLNHNFIQIREDDNLNKLKKACDEVVKKISKDKQKILSYTLVALDPSIPADNSIINEVRDIIIKHWSTFVTNCKDTPITYIRAVVLEALETISKETTSACLIWLTGRNVIKYYSLGREKELLTDFLGELGNRIESEAIEKWALPTDSKFEKIAVEIKDLTGVTIDKTEIENHLKAASIQSGLGEGGENPQYPSNNATAWPVFFSQRAAQGIVEVINKALKKQAKDINANQALIQEAIAKLLAQAQSEIIQRSSMLQMRTELLWWRAALYSQSLNKSYTELDNGVLQATLAKDYSLFVPTLYPISADYFLNETHKHLNADANQKIKITDILNIIFNHSAELKKIFPETNGEEKRISLWNFISGLVWSKYSSAQFKNLVGIEDNNEITSSEFTIWLFHDAQSLKISTNK